MARIVKNGYGFPRGYKTPYFNPGAFSPQFYVPWNGSLISASPARRLIGASQTFNIASVPADLSTFILNGPNGKAFPFQFVYNGSVPGAGSITIPLPASGGSTATQVQTQIASILGLAGGSPVGGGPFLSFPWTYITVNATHFQINWNVAGTVNAITGTQATITQSATSASVFGINPVVPGRFGKNHCWLHGS